MLITEQPSSPPAVTEASAAKVAGPVCIDLRALFGDRFKVVRGELHDSPRGSAPDRDDLWLLIILCRRGHIYVHSSSRLGVATGYRGPSAAALAAIPGVEVLQDGDDGINAAFRIELFDQVAAIVRPRRRRRLAPEHRQRLIEMGKANLKMANSAHVGFPGEARIRPKAPLDDLGHVQARSVAVA
jgi:hypothetical protein